MQGHSKSPNMGYTLDGMSSDVMGVIEIGRSVYLWTSLRLRSLFQHGHDKQATAHLAYSSISDGRNGTNGNSFVEAKV